VVNYKDINKGKANFDAIYNSDTPSLYFQAMQGLDYQIPESSRDTTKKILSNFISGVGGRRIRLLDVGCSYGVNASVLKYGLNLSELFNRYSGQTGREALVKRDREFYASLQAWPELDFLGFDSAAEAVKYAKDCGTIGNGWCANFEHPIAAADTVGLTFEKTKSIDVILSTGCVGYVTERTFDAILNKLKHSPPKVIVSYVLRMFDYTSIAACLRRKGYNTVMLADHTFKQRRCANDEEHSFLLAQLRARGHSPAEAETNGYLCATLYISWLKEAPSPVLEWVDRMKAMIA
jgi:SAM-dependent methyltransferase